MEGAHDKTALVYGVPVSEIKADSAEVDKAWVRNS